MPPSAWPCWSRCSTASPRAPGLGRVQPRSWAPDAAVRTALVHGIDVTMAAGAGFAFVALAIVALFVRTPARAEAVVEADVELEPRGGVSAQSPPGSGRAGVRGGG